VADDGKDDLTQGGVHRDEALEETIETSGGAVKGVDTSSTPCHKGKEDRIRNTLGRGCRKD